jgi:hypothetical protein
VKKRGKHEGTFWQRRRADGRPKDWAAEVLLEGRRITVYGKTRREAQQ